MNRVYKLVSERNTHHETRQARITHHCFILLTVLAFLLLSISWTISAQQEGGRIRYGEMRKRQSKYDPIHRTTKLARRVDVMVFNGLLTFDKDNRPVPRLIDLTKEELLNYEPQNMIIYEFPLRHDVKWHDGTPFTAYDVLFTYLAMKRNPTTRDRVDFIAELNVHGRYTIEFRLKDPILNALGRLAFPIVPHHPFVPEQENVQADNPNCRIPELHEFVAVPIGTGPYKFDPKIQHSNEVRLLVNKNYPLLSDGRIRSYIDEIEMRPFPDAHALAQAVSFGGIDLAVEVPNNLVGTTIKDAESAGKQLLKERYQSLSYYFFALNQEHPFLGGEENQPVRQALNYATNREQWLDAIESGAGILISGPFPHDSPYADSSVQPYEYDPKKAKSLLNDAGFTDTDGDGIREKNGQPFRLTLKQIAGKQKESQICRALINDLRKVGIQVESETIASEEEWEQQVYYNHEFDIVLDTWAFSLGAGLYPLFHSTQSKPGMKNYISYNNAPIDITLQLFREEMDPSALQNLGRDLHRMLHQECPYIFLWTPLRTAVWDSKIRNVQIHPDAFFNYVTEWWIENK